MVTSMIRDEQVVVFDALEQPIMIALKPVQRGALQVFFARRRHALRSLFVGRNYGLKRALDVTVSGLALLALAPLFPIVAIAIKLDSEGPVFFSQHRVGRGGRLFRMWKFRSMVSDAEARKRELQAENESKDGVIFKMANDPRITRLGRFIRKSSIDELPQLFNVLKGDMSLVGPRPPIQSEVDEYALRDLHRLNVIPGITCLWQVSGRSNIGFKQQVRLDMRYAHTQSLFYDIWILLRTVPAVLSKRGAK